MEFMFFCSECNTKLTVIENEIKDKPLSGGVTCCLLVEPCKKCLEPVTKLKEILSGATTKAN